MPVSLVLALFASAGISLASAQVCGRADIQGAYGFQLAGVTTISGEETPVAATGRLVFDPSRKKIDGVSSVNFKGLFLGNTVTGSYEFQDATCKLSFQLQDDSGAYQHFAGAVQPGGAAVEFHQTDPGAGSTGVLHRLPESCSAALVHGAYVFSLSGAATPLATGRKPGSIASAKGSATADGAGNLSITVAKTTTAGTYTVDSECIVQMDFTLASGGSSTSVKLRGVVVDEGRQVLAVQTDPQQTAVARFTSSQPSSVPPR